MNDNTNPKSGSITSPTLLTPCRPVGLRRKHLGVRRSTQSPSVQVKCSDTPETPVAATCSFSTPKVTEESTINIKYEGNEPGVQTNALLENCVKNEQEKTVKRKSSPLEKYISKRKLSHKSNVRTRVLFDSSLNDESLCENQIPPAIRGEENEAVQKKFTSDLEDDKQMGVGTSKLPVSTQVNIFSNTITGKPINDKLVSMSDFLALKERVESKAKRLKELELATLYKKKHNLDQVGGEIDCWLEGCRDALNDLQSALLNRGQSYSLCELLQKLGIPPSLIGVEDDD